LPDKIQNKIDQNNLLQWLLVTASVKPAKFSFSITPMLTNGLIFDISIIAVIGNGTGSEWSHAKGDR
jgi:hypothetical protein